MRTLRYISSLLLLIQLSSEISAQGQDTLTRVRGPRISYDLAGLGLLYFDPGRMVHTLSVDFEAWQDIYTVIDLGYQTVSLDKDIYSYSSSGMFARLGVDVNLLKYQENWVYEMFYTGLRYGISYMSHQAEDLTFGDDYQGVVSSASTVENQVNAHFLSVVGGVKVELCSNFFIGWNVMVNIKLAGIKDKYMTPYYIPGFGKGDRKLGLIFNYTLSYRIPMQTYIPKKIIKKKNPPPAEE